ncbi:Transposon-encoded protein TnpW, partial [Dysosmobacter welbionis]
MGQVRPDQGGQVAAHLIAEGELAVGEGAGAGEAGGDVAVGLAVHALLGLVLGAVALFHRLSLF